MVYVDDMRAQYGMMIMCHMRALSYKRRGVLMTELHTVRVKLHLKGGKAQPFVIKLFQDGNGIGKAVLNNRGEWILVPEGNSVVDFPLDLYTENCIVQYAPDLMSLEDLSKTRPTLH